MAAKTDRRSEVFSQLNARDLTPERFLELALEAEEIKRIDVSRMTGWTPSKVDEVNVGFDPPSIETYILESKGPGRYRFSPIWSDGTILTHKVWGFGDFTEPNSNPATVPASSASADSTEKILKQMADQLKSMGVLEQFHRMIQDGQAASLNREIAPMKMVADMMEKLLNAQAAQVQVASGGAKGADSEMIGFLKEELREVRSQLRDITAKGNATPAQASGIAEQIKGIAEVAALLGFRKLEGVEGAAEAGSSWTPSDVKELVASGLAAASPVLSALGQFLQVKLMQSVNPAAGALPVQSVPSTTDDEGDMTMGGPVKLPPEIQEILDAAHEALRSKDFASVRYAFDEVLVQPDGRPIVAIKPEAGPMIHLLKLKRVDARFDSLRAEFAEFLRWCAAEDAKLEAAGDDE